MLVVARDELSDHSTSLLQILKAVDVEDLLLQDAVKAFDDPVALRAPDKSRRMDDAQIGDLRSKVMGVVLAAVVPPEGQARTLGNAFARGAELSFDRLLHGLQSCEAVADLGLMMRQDLIVRVVDHAEEPAGAFGSSPELVAIGPPHLVGGLSPDHPVMGTRGSVGFRPDRRQEFVVPHEPQHAFPADFQAVSSQAGKHFLVAF